MVVRRQIWVWSAALVLGWTGRGRQGDGSRVKERGGKKEEGESGLRCGGCLGWHGVLQDGRRGRRRLELLCAAGERRDIKRGSVADRGAGNEGDEGEERVRRLCKGERGK
ncbi:hypothetical protein HAX54_029909 [Datura stramonium]|uniref:Secreted protein n=1 Tax=Datura stramonium TaxID=4076 RepID=A0ABS8V6S7_DATST|nr:hypothetical protein [Datura stramonium]